MKAHAGSDLRERKNVREDVVYAFRDEEWSREQFIALLDQVPEAYRPTTVIQYELDRYDGGASFRISYTRPETDDEVNQRVSRALEYARQQQSDEKATFERLRAKYA